MAVATGTTDGGKRDSSTTYTPGVLRFKAIISESCGQIGHVDLGKPLRVLAPDERDARRRQQNLLGHTGRRGVIGLQAHASSEASERTRSIRFKDAIVARLRHDVRASTERL